MSARRGATGAVLAHGALLLLPSLLLAAPRARAQGARDARLAAPLVTLEDSLALVVDDARLGMPAPAACPVVPLWTNLEWQWRATPTAMLDAVRRLRSVDDSAALARVRALQRDAIVSNRYQSCHDASPPFFWRLALTASSPRVAPLESCLRDLDWQRGAARGSLRAAARRLGDAQRPAAADSLPDPFAPVAAMAILLDRQSRNPRALERYRACFRDAPEVLLDAVRTRAR